jgi:hypothetical protein
MTDLLIDTNHGDQRSIEEIVNAKIPKQVFDRYQIAVTLVKDANEENFDRIVEYILKPEFSDEYSIAVIMEVIRRNPKMCDTKAFVNWARQFKSIEL